MSGREQLHDRLTDLERWRLEVESEMDASCRRYLRRIMEQTRVWAGVSASVMLILGISIAGAYRSVDWRVDNVGDTLKLRLDRMVDRTVLTNQAIDATRDAVENSILQNIEAHSRSQLSYTLSQVKILLQTQLEHAGESSHGGADAHMIKRTMYQVDALLDAYADPSSRVQMVPERREALSYLVNGIVELAEGDMDRAERWYVLAECTDETFAEPLLFHAQLAMFRLQDAEDDQQLRNRYEPLVRDKIQRALDISPRESQSAHEAQVYACFVHRYGGGWPPQLRLKSAISAANRQIEADRRKGQVDPRLFYFRGIFEWSMAKYSLDKKGYRLRAIDDMAEALARDRQFLDAMNNYIWFSTHVDDSDQLVTSLSDSERTSVSRYVGYLSSEPSVQHSPEWLNTIGEAYCVLGSPLAQKNLRRSVQEAEWHARGPRAAASVEWYRKRLQKLSPKT